MDSCDMDSCKMDSCKMEFDFLHVADVIHIHHDQLGRYGGREGLRDL